MKDDLGNTDEGVQTDDDAVDALKGLLKANRDNNDNIFKAKDNGRDKDDDDDDANDYNETYMKKNMSKFMKNNPGFMKKMGYMKKAIDDAYDVANNDGDLEAEATMVDGTEIFKSFKEMTNTMLKAFISLADRVDDIENQVAFNNELSAANGEVLIKACETLEQISNVPLPPKSQLVDFSLHKAKNQPENPGGSNTLQKAMNLGIHGAKKILVKAAMDGNSDAGRVLTQVESCFGNLQLLPPNSLKVITDLAPQD